MKPQRIAFAGTPEFAAVVLRALLAAGFDIPLVLTQPDRPAGRGKRMLASAVKQLAQAHGIAVQQPPTLREAAARAPLSEAAVDVLVTAAYGLILPQAALDIPRMGCINVHASLLPRWRGAAPIQRCIEAGDESSGVTIMQVEAGLDSGPMLLAQATPLAAAETAASLHDKLAPLGARLVVQALRDYDCLQPQPQDAAAVTCAAKVSKDEAAIDWRRPASEIERRLRAFDPFPGCSSVCAGSTVKIWRAALVDGAGAPGEVIDVAPQRLHVACGEGALSLLELQKPGGRRLAVADYLRGCNIVRGACFT